MHPLFTFVAFAFPAAVTCVVSTDVTTISSLTPHTKGCSTALRSHFSYLIEFHSILHFVVFLVDMLLFGYVVYIVFFVEFTPTLGVEMQKLLQAQQGVAAQGAGAQMALGYGAQEAFGAVGYGDGGYGTAMFRVS